MELNIMITFLVELEFLLIFTYTWILDDNFEIIIIFIFWRLRKFANFSWNIDVKKKKKY